MHLQTPQKTFLKNFAGITLITFGVVGMIVPVLPGWWVALIGLQLLGLKLVINKNNPWHKVIIFKWDDTVKIVEKVKKFKNSRALRKAKKLGRHIDGIDAYEDEKL
ncbi:hypothetical protein HYV31_03625 [candidate division WWE3 bacterium]|nr:hypothetical protein [candidate division WWE3 bacterium]